MVPVESADPEWAVISKPPGGTDSETVIDHGGLSAWQADDFLAFYRRWHSVSWPGMAWQAGTAPSAVVLVVSHPVDDDLLVMQHALSQDRDSLSRAIHRTCIMRAPLQRTIAERWALSDLVAMLDSVTLRRPLPRPRRWPRDLPNTPDAELELLVRTAASVLRQESVRLPTFELSVDREPASVAHRFDRMLVFLPPSLRFSRPILTWSAYPHQELGLYLIQTAQELPEGRFGSTQWGVASRRRDDERDGYVQAVWELLDEWRIRKTLLAIDRLETHETQASIDELTRLAEPVRLAREGLENPPPADFAVRAVQLLLDRPEAMEDDDRRHVVRTLLERATQPVPVQIVAAHWDRDLVRPAAVAAVRLGQVREFADLAMAHGMLQEFLAESIRAWGDPRLGGTATERVHDLVAAACVGLANHVLTCVAYADLIGECGALQLETLIQDWPNRHDYLRRWAAYARQPDAELVPFLAAETGDPAYAATSADIDILRRQGPEYLTYLADLASEIPEHAWLVAARLWHATGRTAGVSPAPTAEQLSAAAAYLDLFRTLHGRQQLSGLLALDPADAESTLEYARTFGDGLAACSREEQTTVIGNARAGHPPAAMLVRLFGALIRLGVSPELQTQLLQATREELDHADAVLGRDTLDDWLNLPRSVALPHDLLDALGVAYVRATAAASPSVPAAELGALLFAMLHRAPDWQPDRVADAMSAALGDGNSRLAGARAALARAAELATDVASRSPDSEDVSEEERRAARTAVGVVHRVLLQQVCPDPATLRSVVEPDLAALAVRLAIVRHLLELAPVVGHAVALLDVLAESQQLANTIDHHLRQAGLTPPTNGPVLPAPMAVRKAIDSLGSWFSRRTD